MARNQISPNVSGYEWDNKNPSEQMRMVRGYEINADVNGAVNILKKYLRDFLSRSIGVVAMPSVARITNVCPS